MSDEREPTIDEVREKMAALPPNMVTERRMLVMLLRRMEEDAETVALVERMRQYAWEDPFWELRVYKEADAWLARRKR